MNNSLFGERIEHIRKHRDIKLVSNDQREHYLVLEPNYHTTKWFSGNLITIKMTELKISINKPV